MVKDSLCFRICRVVQLEAAIKQQAVDLVRANPTTDIVGCLEHKNGGTMNGALTSGCQTCDTGTNDDDVVRHRLGALECLRDG